MTHLQSVDTIVDHAIAELDAGELNALESSLNAIKSRTEQWQAAATATAEGERRDDGIFGATIVGVRTMTDQEEQTEGWNNSRDGPAALVLDTGVVLYPSSDQEGNGPGALFGMNHRDGQLLEVTPHPEDEPEPDGG